MVKTKAWHEEQRKAIRDLKNGFPEMRIKFSLEEKSDHDRYIEVTRSNGGKSRAIIGVGLDFIDPNGHVRKTFLIFQSVYEEAQVL